MYCLYLEVEETVGYDLQAGVAEVGGPQVEVLEALEFGNELATVARDVGEGQTQRLQVAKVAPTL